MEILVLTISDRASKGIYDDLSGPALEKTLKASVDNVVIHKKIVPDEKTEIRNAFDEYTRCDFIITTGGTGISPRDVTPETTIEWCDRMVDGIPEYFRAESIKQTKNAVLSRAVAGVKGKTMVINLPGSLRGATFCMELFIPLMSHITKMIAGCGHE